MSIFFVTNTLTGGGAEKQLLLTAAGLAERGHRCAIFSLAPAPGHVRYADLIARCRAVGVRIVSPGHAAAIVMVAARLIGAVLAGCRPLIWTWGFRAELLRLLLPPLWLGRGVVAIRSASEDEVRRRAWLLRATSPFTFRYLANSHRGLQMFAAAVPSIRRRGRVVYNALEPVLLDASPGSGLGAAGTLHLAMLGNLLWQIKGYDIALEVARQIRTQNLSVRISIGGHLPAGAADPNPLFRASGVAETIHWVGRVAQPTEFLRSADGFLLLSRFEGTSNSLLEAMALGLPCIATNVGDLEQFKREGAALDLVPVADVEAVIAVIGAWAADFTPVRRRGLANQLFCRTRFSETRMLQDTEAALNLPAAR